ncbi:PLP-dependent transferase [Amniculicola lignicola CBS 123094]|uniref:PLP-dependent transferase n=1 Tax=Amniculicola lignicola CBS 123094 TaxID=1392246 RepID=A0A6A5WJR1_9PLEO|nr:PLP-dependent transferase [Amniculicola lignicola CBS 123094]
MAPPTLSPSTLAVHADDRINTLTDVAPAIHPSTTFRYPRDHTKLQPVPENGEEFLDLSTPLVYSRLTNANVNRLETILTPLIYPNQTGEEVGGIAELSNHAVSYTSGLSAFHALIVSVTPKVVAISGGYHGCHGVLDLHKRMSGVKLVDLHAGDAEWEAAGLGKGDLVHLETPLNPTGEAFEIATYAERAHRFGALLSVDATFAPPGLQDPFVWGADVVMHSGTKYIGGHSDMLCGILATRPTAEGKKMAKGLRLDRIFLGSVLGSLEGWLGVRSLRTLELRVQRQSQNASKLAAWLSDAVNGKGEEKEVQVVKKVVAKVTHASLQAALPGNEWLPKQMPNGYGPVFAIYTHEPQQAKELPSSLQLFHHATSLGGVESLIEWRRMSDVECDERLLRVSVGVESWEDLKADLLEAFRAIGTQDAEVNKEKTLVVGMGEKGAEVKGGAAGAV